MIVYNDLQKKVLMGETYMSENRITQEKAVTVKIIFNSQHKTEELKAFRILIDFCVSFLT